MCLRKKLKLTYHYILSYIYNSFIVRHKRRIYFKNRSLKPTYVTYVCNFRFKSLIFKKKCKNEYTYTVVGLINGGGGLYPGGLISGIIYSLANGLAYIRGLKTGGL